MRAVFGIAVLFLTALVLVGTSVKAQDNKKADTKEVTLKGTITCLKCGLHKAEKCATLIVVKTDDKTEVNYLFDKASNEKYHSDICRAAKTGSVTGVVTEADGKKTIAVKDVKYDDKK